MTNGVRAVGHETFVKQATRVFQRKVTGSMPCGSVEQPVLRSSVRETVISVGLPPLTDWRRLVNFLAAVTRDVKVC